MTSLDREGVNSITVQFSPQFYHWFVRRQWFTKKYIHDHVQANFQFDGQVVLDFGSGTGANCSMFHPHFYLGIDPDVRRIDYARRLYPRHKFHVFDGKELPVGNETVDNLLIIAVLHHIPSEEIASYMKEFKRILKPTGTIIVMEPCLCKEKPLWFMKWYDNGEYIRNEEEYIQLFRDHNYDCNVIKRFRKCFLYHELFYRQAPNEHCKGRLINHDNRISSQNMPCLASLKSAQANLEQFALNTQNQEAKTLFTNAAQTTQQVIQQVQDRVQQLENEEPQYKGF